MHALNDVVQILHLAASQPDITHHDQRRVGRKPQPLFAPVAAVVEEALLQHAVFVVAQQRAILRSGKPCLELRKIPGCQKILPLGGGQGRALKVCAEADDGGFGVASLAFSQIKPAKINLSLFGRLAELAGLEVLGELVQNFGLVAEHHV